MQRNLYRPLSRIAFFLVLLHLATPARAEPSQPSTLSEEQLLFQEIPSVFTASKYEQKITEAPASVSVVTADEIKKYGYRTLGDILRSLRGFYVTYDRNYHYLGVRGFGRPGDYNTRVLLLLDGHRLNDNIYNTAAIGTEFPLNVDIIERVEVVRGPGSSLYGANAFFAVVNVFTRRGRDLKGLEISGAAGSQETYQGTLSYGDRFENGFEMLVSGSAYHSDGDDRLYFKEFDDPATNNGVAENGDNDRARNGFSKISYHDFTLEAAYSSRKKDVPTAPWDTIFNDQRLETTDNIGFLDLKYSHIFPNDFDVTARLSYDYYYYKGNYPYDYPPITLMRDTADGKWWGGALQVTKKIFENHKVILGGEYQYNFDQDQRVRDVEPFFEYLDDRRESKNWGVFIQDEMRLRENLLFYAGLRYDYYDTFGSSTNPRLALVYTPFEQTVFRFLYGTAFRAPNAYELYYNDGGVTTKANPDLDPETIKTYECAWEQYFGDHFRGVISPFYYEIDNLISLQADPDDNLLVFENVEKVKAKGVEFELDAKWENGLEGRIGYTFQHAEDEETNNTLSNSPKHLAKFNLIVPLLRERIFLGTEVLYTSRRKTGAGGDVGDFFLTNVTLFSRNIFKGLEVSASIYNVTDKKYSDPASEEHVQNGIEQDGRTFRVKLTYYFPF